MNHKTSKKDFEYFKERCKYWQKELGLMRWELTFFHSELKDKRAEIVFDEEGCSASAHLSTDWGDIYPTKKEVDYSALHEVLHLLFAKLTGISEEYFARNYVVKLEHEIITSLTNLIVKP